MGVGRGARIRRTVSNPGYQIDRSSTPLSERFQTPPILSLSPIPSRTPEGVYTQVQKGNGDRGSDRDSNNTDDLFNDSFDIDDVEIPETTLTQEFPKCNVQMESAQPAYLDDNATKSNTESVPKTDDSGKVIRFLKSIRHADQDFWHPDSLNNFCQQNPYFPGETKAFRPYMMRVVDGSAEFDAVRSYRIPEIDGPAPTDMVHIPLGDTDSGMISSGSGNGGCGTGDNGLQDQHEQPRGLPENNVDDNVTNNNNNNNNNGGATSSRLSQDRIRSLLAELCPDPSVKSSHFQGNIATAIPTSIPKDASWGNQVPVRFDDSCEPIRLVPVANDSGRGGKPLNSDHSEEIAAAVQQVRHATVKMVDGNVQATGLEKHKFSMVGRKDIETKKTFVRTGDEMGSKKFKLTIPELLLPIRSQSNVTFECGEIVKFIMVARNKITKRWTVPSRQRFHDIINQVDNKLRREHMYPTLGVLAWNYEWNGVGVMGLRVTDTAVLHSYRSAINLMEVGDMTYNTYPKVSLNQDIEISLYLKPELRCLDLEFIPHSLLENNVLLDGNIAVRYSKNCYNSSDDLNNSLDGTLVLLEGDREFVKSVGKYPGKYQFRLGSSTVSIRHNGEDQRQEQLGSESVGIDVIENLSSSEITQSPKTRFANRWGQDQGRVQDIGFPKPVPAAAQSLDHLASLAASEITRGRGRGRNRTWVRGGVNHRRLF